MVDYVGSSFGQRQAGNDDRPPSRSRGATGLKAPRVLRDLEGASRSLLTNQGGHRSHVIAPVQPFKSSVVLLLQRAIENVRVDPQYFSAVMRFPHEPRSGRREHHCLPMGRREAAGRYSPQFPRSERTSQEHRHPPGEQ